MVLTKGYIILISAVKDIIERLKKEGVTEEELETYREKFAVEYRRSIKSITSKDIVDIAKMLLGEDLLEAELLLIKSNKKR